MFSFQKNKLYQTVSRIKQIERCILSNMLVQVELRLQKD